MRILLMTLLLATGLDAAAAAVSGKAGGPIHVALAPVTVPLFRGNYVQGSFHLKLILAVDTEQDRKSVERMIPRLEAGYLDLLTRMSKTSIRPGEPTDLQGIATALQAITDQVLGGSKARLLIEESAIRR